MNSILAHLAAIFFKTSSLKLYSWIYFEFYSVGTEQAGLKCRKTEKECEEFEFHCDNQECIHVNNLCDRKVDCRDGSDEDHSRCSKPFQV